MFNYQKHEIVSFIKGFVIGYFAIEIICWFFKALAGVRTEGEVTLVSNGKKLGSEYGELMFTAYGISGIPVMQVSRFAAKALDLGQEVEAVLDLFPELPQQALYEELYRRIETARVQKSKTYEQTLIGLLNHKLNYVMLKEIGIEPVQIPTGNIEKKVRQLAKKIKEFHIVIIDTNGFDNAQACAGGVATEELTENME